MKKKENWTGKGKGNKWKGISNVKLYTVIFSNNIREGKGDARLPSYYSTLRKNPRIVCLNVACKIAPHLQTFKSLEVRCNSRVEFRKKKARSSASSIKYRVQKKRSFKNSSFLWRRTSRTSKQNLFFLFSKLAELWLKDV